VTPRSCGDLPSPIRAWNCGAAANRACSPTAEERSQDMVGTLARILNSRVWIGLSIVCLFFALYETAEKIIMGHDVEGLLDGLVTVVIAVNLVNKLKWLVMYTEKLRP
jgi:hypothetical protein